MKLLAALSCALTGLLCYPVLASAGPCTPPKVNAESPYEYMLELTQALASAHNALGRIDRLPADAGPYETLVQLRLGESDYRCAEGFVVPFGHSRTDAIKASALALATSFARLDSLNEASASICRALLDSTGRLSSSPATLAEKQADIGSGYELVWKAVVLASVLSTHSIVEADPATGKMSHLALTKTQQDEIVRVLRETFGAGIATAEMGDKHPLEIAAWVLYRVVADPERLPRGR